jgi:hypothetical protein
MFISEYKLDPWLLNKKNQTSFDLLNSTIHFKTYNELHNIWKNIIFNGMILKDTNNTNTNNSNITIFGKIKNKYDDSASNIIMNKIFMYI